MTELVRGRKEQRGTGRDTVPDTVQAAVLARLDLLRPQERTVLQAAAVGGRTFRPATLQAVLAELRPGEVDGALDGLLTRDLIAPDEGGAFTFRHILIRDVAYGMLSRADRIRMHAAVAAWLEQYAADRLDEFVELIAYHYREAVLLSRRSTVPVPLPFDPARAVHFLERAGELAGRAGALAEARGHLESAVAIAPVEERSRLYEKLGDCLFEVPDMGLAAYRQALSQWFDLAIRSSILHMRSPLQPCRAEGEHGVPAPEAFVRRTEMQQVRSLLTERGRYPSRRTFERRLKAIPDTLPAQIGCLGRHLVALLHPWEHDGRAAALDSTVLQARAIFVYQLALLYRHEHAMGLNVGLKPFLQAA